MIHVVSKSREIFERFARWTDVARVRGEGYWVHARQIELARWQAANFDDLDDRNFALGVAEESGEFSEARNGEDVTDAIGDVGVFLGQLLYVNRLSIDPMLKTHPDDSFLRDSAARCRSVGQLCHVVLKGRQRIRGFDNPDVYRTELGLAAWDVAVSHGVTAKIYLAVSEQVLERSWK